MRTSSKTYTTQKHSCFFRKSFLFAALILLSLPGYAQLEVASGNFAPYNPDILIEDVLLGEGVEILNIQYDGPTQAVGYFNDGTDAVGFEEGIVLTTGFAVSEGSSSGIVEEGLIEASANNNSTATDPDIDFLAEGEPVFNLAKYTITFVPSSDRMSFRYVFASEEYPEFACTDYNDFFGFFISGPGINGTFANNAENIALIPGTNLPVRINNIHPQNPTNPSCTPEFENLFNDNNGSTDFPVYDGYLDIFIAEAEVVPCETYTIKLVIADIGDAQRDSGVFFEAKSFNSQGFEVIAESQSIDASLVEGCTEGSFLIQIDEPATSDITLDYQMVGEALNGIDYEEIAGNIVIPAGQTSVTVPVIPLTDSNTEGTESIGFDIQINDCTRDTFYLYLRDPTLEMPDLGDDLSGCAGESYTLDGTINTQGTNEPTFSSDPADAAVIIGPFGGNPPQPLYRDLEVAGINPPELRPDLIQSVCLNIDHPRTEDLDVYLYAPGGQFILLTSDNGGNGDNYTQTCFSPDATQSITFDEQFAPESAAPFTGTFQPEGNWETLWFGDSPVNGTWRLLLIDDESSSTGMFLDWSITFNSDYEVSYAWSPADGLSCTDCPMTTATPTATTDYTLTVTDTYGCSVSDEITIEVIEAYAAPVVTCTDIQTDQLTFTWEPVTGADGYELQINNSGTWIAPNDPPLSHTVTGLGINETVDIMIRAVGDCDALLGFQNCTTIDCGSFDISDDNSDASCFGAEDASIFVTSSGLNGAHTYTLDEETNTTGVFENLVAGDYSVLITDEAGCTETYTTTLSQPAAITSDITVANQIDCNNSTASVSVTAAGGTNDFTYAWSNNTTGATTTFSAVGEYFVTVTDGNNCVTTDSVDIISEGELAATIDANTVCADSNAGEATVTVTAGAEPISYQWDAAAGGQTTATATDLAPGDYSVTVTSADDCELILTAAVGSFPALTLTLSSNDASCGNADGSATATPGGGSGNFTYVWSNMQTTQTISNLPAGEYTVTVTDENMCTAVESVGINTPSTITLADLNTTDAICNGENTGAVSLTAAGGTAPLSYTLEVLPEQDNGNFANLSAGMYNMVVTDAGGCVATFPFTINEPAALVTVPVTVNDISCAEPQGTATVSVTGGTFPYAFAWSNMQTDSIVTSTTPGNFTVTITDGAGCTAENTVTIGEAEMLDIEIFGTQSCPGADDAFAFVNVVGGTAPFVFNWQDGTDNDTLYNLAPGNYAVTVTDAAGCEETANIDLDAFPAMTLTTSATQADCDGTPNGSATVSVSGGTPDFTYLWNDAVGQMTATAGDLAAGNYTVTVTDTNGCTETAEATVTTPSALVIGEVSATGVTCFDGNDGSATVGSVSSQAGGVTYLWSDPAMQTTATAENLTPGNYTVTVNDAADCPVTATVTVENAEEILLTFNITDVLCAADSDGEIDLTVSGGAIPYTYLWSNNATTEDLNNLTAGIYEVTVTDTNDCQAIGSATIMTTAPINVTHIVTDASCYNYDDGAILTDVNGGVEPYTYAWSNGATIADLDAIAAGTYTLTVTDGNGCGIFSTVTVGQPPVFEATVEITEPLCAGNPTGELAITPVGGSPDYLYSIDGLIFGEDSIFTNLIAQDYDIFVQDANGCIYTGDTLLSEPQTLFVTAGEDQTVEIGDRAFLQAAAAGGTGEIALQWTTPAAGLLSCTDCDAPFAALNNTETFTVTATDVNGCTASDEVTVFVNKRYDLYIPNAFSPDLDGFNDTFYPMGKPTTLISSMMIFDRWGNKVHESGDFFTTGENQGWNGKKNGMWVGNGVYVYVVEAIFADGVSVLFKGDVTVIR